MRAIHTISELCQEFRHLHSRHLHRLQYPYTEMYNFKHLNTIDLNLLEFGVIGGMSSLCNRYLSPLLVGRHWDTLVLKCFELLEGTL